MDIIHQLFVMLKGLILHTLFYRSTKVPVKSDFSILRMPKAANLPILLLSREKRSAECAMPSIFFTPQAGGVCLPSSPCLV